MGDFKFPIMARKAISYKMKRIFDITLALFLIPFLAIPAVVIAIAVFSTSDGPIIHWSKRFGKNCAFFLMPKFRTMINATPNLPTDQLKNAEEFLTPIGKYLRLTSLDEIPQIYSILLGHMSFVGPRPALFNQHDLIKLRQASGINALRPGLTGLAQIMGRDDLSITKKLS